MMNYLKLVNFELKRFIKIYFVLIGLTIVLQLTGVIVVSRSYVQSASEAIYGNAMQVAEYVERYGALDMSRITQTPWFFAPVALSAAALIFYCFLIWYRDWFGKNTFIYRLLMLPTERMNVFFAKASAIFLMVLGLVGLQLILLLIGQLVMQWIAPLELRVDLTVSQIISGSPGGYLHVLIPENFTQFLINYGIGFMVVFTLFTAILFERSFRLKGILFGVLYFLFANTLFLSPILIEAFFTGGYLYLGELIGLELICGLLVTALSLGVSHYLLNRKINV
jgi:hypothetical protein